jgi:hypothetical protein
MLLDRGYGVPDLTICLKAKKNEFLSQNGKRKNIDISLWVLDLRSKMMMPVL